MLIPTKFNGYQAGIRLYPSGGGSGGPPAPQNSQEAMARGSPLSNMAKQVSPKTSTSSGSQLTVDQGFTPYVGPRTPSQVGRSMPGEAPFLQPIYNSQYNNYANPLTAGGVSNYGTVEAPSAGYRAAMSPGGGGLSNYYQGLRQFGADQGSQPYGMNYAEFNPARKALGASQSDLMAANSYNPMQGFGYGGDQFQQMQTPFNPYASNYQSPFSYGGYQSPFGGGGYQSPFSYGGGGQQLPQSMYGGVYGGRGGMGGMPFRGNMMRYEEGGIASLLDELE